MFNQTKFFKVTFLFSILILVLLYGFTAGTWHVLDVSKQLIFEVSIHRILYASRYTLAVMPIIATAIFSIALLLSTKEKKLNKTPPFVINKFLFIIMLEMLITQCYIQYLLIRRSINIILPGNELVILTVLGSIIVASLLAFVFYIIFRNNNSKIAK